jgi:hypothetical protein
VGAPEGHLGEPELARFADGSLPARRRRRIARRLEQEPYLRAVVEEQRAAVAAIRALDLPAREQLHARVRWEPAPRRSGPVVAGGLAAAVALALLVLLLVPRGEEAPSVLAVARLAERGPAAAPPRSPALEGVPFPDYERRFGWRATGMRSDAPEGRATRTIFYTRGARRLAYSIVSGGALAWPRAARRAVRDGVPLHHLRRGRTTIVTWLREGHTCVLTANGVSRAELLRLAAWEGRPGKDRASAVS